MLTAWRALWLLSCLSRAHAACSPTSFYRNCWIRRFPGLYIAVEESESRGAAVLQLYREESALRCSRACCLSTNVSCNLAVYHYNTTQDSTNCFHLHCPTLESCILRQRGNVILYNVTKGVDPDLLVFGKYISSNFRVLPNHASSRFNVSEPLASDKRQFNRPHIAPSSSTHPATPAASTSTSSILLKSEIPSSSPVPVHSTQGNSLASSIQSSTLESPTQGCCTHATANHEVHTATTSTNWASTAPQVSTQKSTQGSFTRETSPPQPASITIPVVSPISSQITKGLVNNPMTTTGASALVSEASQSTADSTNLQIMLSSTVASTSTTGSTISQTPVASTTASANTQTPVASTSTSASASKTIQTSVTSTTASTNGQTAYAYTQSSITFQITPASVVSSKTIQTTLASIRTFTTIQKGSAYFHTQTASTATFNSKPSITTTFYPLKSIQQNPANNASAHSELVTILNSTNSTMLSTSLTTAKTTTQHRGTNSQAQITNQETTTLPNQPTNIPSPNSPLEVEGTTLSPTTTGQVFTSSYGIKIEDSTTSDGPTTSVRLSSPPAASVSTSLTPPTSMEDSQPFPNDTKGYISRNITTGDSPRPEGDEGLTPVWHLAANTVLVALATCVTIAFGCCCSVLMVVSWRGRRRRKGRYRTTLSGKRGSMRLIKYVIVRESS